MQILSMSRALNILLFPITKFIMHRVVSLCQQWLLMGLCRGGGEYVYHSRSFPLIKHSSLPLLPSPSYLCRALLLSSHDQSESLRCTHGLNGCHVLERKPHPPGHAPLRGTVEGVHESSCGSKSYNSMHSIITVVEVATLINVIVLLIVHKNVCKWVTRYCTYCMEDNAYHV